MQETPVRFLSREDPLEEGMATQYSILAWRIPVDRGACWATVHGGHKESDMTEQLNNNNLEISVCLQLHYFKKYFDFF